MITFPALFSSNLGGGGSGEPITWTSRQALSSGTGGVGVKRGNSNWLVNESGSSWYASDPTGSWTQRSNQPSSSYNNGIIHDGTYFITSTYEGTTGYIKSTTSVTGTWTPKASYLYYNTINFDIGSTYYVGVGYDSSANTFVIYATDPTLTWNTNSQTGWSDKGYIKDVAYGNGYWVAVGNTQTPTGQLIYQTDPTGTWTLNSNHAFDNVARGVAYGNGYWVAVGNNGTNGVICTTTDPTGTWTEHGSPPFTDTIHSVAYGNNAWVVVGNNGKIATCGSDPTGTWTLRKNVGSDSFRRVSYGSDNYWVAVGTAGIYTASPGA